MTPTNAGPANAIGTRLTPDTDNGAGGNGGGRIGTVRSGSDTTISSAQAQLLEARGMVAQLQSRLELAEYNAKVDLEEAVLGLDRDEVQRLAEPWLMFTAALREQIQGGDDWRGVQIVGAPLAASWNDPKYGAYRAYRVFGDTRPTWGATYGDSGLRISRGYYLFITNLDIPLPDPVERRRADEARKRYVAELDALQALQEQVGPNWKRFDERQAWLPVSRRMSFDAWYAKFDGKKIAAQNERVSIASQEFSAYIVRAYGGYAFAANLLSDYENPAYQLQATSDTDELMNFYRTYSISPDLGAWIEGSKKLAADGAPPKLQFDITKESRRYDYSSTRWGARASWFGFFGSRAGGTRETVDVTNEKFRMTFSAANVETFTIRPGQWMSLEALKILQNGPFIDGGPIASGAVKLFGPDGILNLVPTQLIVAFRPKVVATMSKDEFHYVKSEFHASGGLSIGPFGFGGSYGRTSVSTKFDAESNTVTMEDVSDVPQVMAVVSRALPDFE